MTLFPVPCPVCGADDEHEAWRSAHPASGFAATYCPHPEAGHGTGCCCAGWSKSPFEVYYPGGLLTSPPPLGPDEVRQLLRECVTVVRPGETLVVRAYENTTPHQLRELQDAADVMCEQLGFRVLVVYGEELGVVEADTAP